MVTDRRDSTFTGTVCRAPVSVACELRRTHGDTSERRRTKRAINYA